METLEQRFFGDNFIDLRGVNKINHTMKIPTRLTANIRRIVFHCTDASGWSPQRLNDFFLNERKFPTCGYHHYVMADKVYQMVSPLVVSYHAAGHNSDTISFSIDYDATRAEKLNIPIDPKVYDNAVKTAMYLCLKYKIYPQNIFGHRELFGTGFLWINNDHKSMQLVKTCPGLKIDLDLFRHVVTKGIQNDLGLVTDGIFGPKSKQAFDAYAT